MASRTGHMTISDLLAARFASESIAGFGEDTIAEILQNDIAAHNQIMEEMISGLCDVSTDRQRRAGSSVTGEMVEVDEHGRAPTQRDLPGSTVGFPLKLFQFPVGWTRKWLETASVQDMAIKADTAEKVDKVRVVTEIKKAIYLSSNYTHRDHLVDNVDLSVKRFVNADGDPIPDGPNGETFDGSSHTHFDANAGLTNAVLLALVDDVVEHGHGGMVKLVIARANESAVRGLADFTPYQDPRVTLNANANEAMARLDITRLDNRAIGIFGAAEVWVKPWAITGYAFCYSEDGPKPLVFRQRSQESLQGLRMAAEFENHPLHIDFFEREFGVGVWTRTNGAVLDFVNGSYTDPSI